MVKKKRDGLKLEINFTNRWLYTLIVLFSFVLVGVVVYAQTPPNPGHYASEITGTLDSSQIPNLAASKITSGEFSPFRIPNLPASKITHGRFNSGTYDFSGTVRTLYLDPRYKDDKQEYLRFGSPNNYYTGFMYNIKNPTYGLGNNFAIFTYDNRPMTFRASNFSFLSGDVGIGVTDPQAKLHVAGDVRIDDSSVDRSGTDTKITGKYLRVSVDDADYLIPLY